MQDDQQRTCREIVVVEWLASIDELLPEVGRLVRMRVL